MSTLQTWPHRLPSGLCWLFGGAGVLCLLLALRQALALDLGSGTAKAAVALLLLLTAALTLYLLRRQGHCPSPVLLLCLLPVGLAILLRTLALDHQTLDYQWFLSQWAATFREGGGFAALKEPIGNYNIPYLYLLAAISYWDIPDLYLIKWISILFDVLLAWGVLRLVRRLVPHRPGRGAAAFCISLLLPTVVLNGAVWAQCDSIYAALVLHALSCALEKRPGLSVVLLSLAFSFKLQAIFLVPLWCVFWYTGRVKFRHLFLFPAAYAGAMLPAVLLGKPLKDVLGIYLDQAGSQAQHAYLNFNSPSIFGFLPYRAQVNEALFSKLGILAAFLLVLALLALLFPLRRRLSDQALLAAALAMAVGVPFFLPYMHERYFFLADMISLIWACTLPRRIPQAAAVQAASLGGYHAYLRGRYALPLSLFGVTFSMALESALMLLGLGSALILLWRLSRVPAAE